MEAGAREIDNVDGKDVVWTSDAYTLDHVLMNMKKDTLVKVDEGAMNDEDDILECGEILTIHGEIKMLQIMATDENGLNQHIPIHCVHEVEIMTLSDEIYKTVRDICNAVNPPGMVENTKQFTYYGQTFTTGNQFQINSVYTENNKVAGLSMICISPEKRRISLASSVRGDFKEVLQPTDRGKQLMIKDLVGRQLPLCVRFTPTGEKNPKYGPRLGRVTLKELQEVDMVSATAHEKDGAIYKPFSRQLDVRLVIAKEIVIPADNIYTPVGWKGNDEEDEYVTMNPNNIRSVKNANLFQRCPNEYKQDCSFPSVTAPKEDINDILRYLHLEAYIQSFNEKQVDADLLGSLNEQTFTSEINMTLFEAEKLKMYLDGWRPLTDMSSLRGPYQLDKENPKHWTVKEVSRRMKAIQLPEFAQFCLNNQVDGNLLERIANKDTIKSIGITHGVDLSPLQETKLTKYVRGWRPKTATQWYAHAQ